MVTLMKFNSIKDVFDYHIGDLIIDQKLAHRIIGYSNRFVTKNQDHIKFFGSNLLGVHPVRYTDDDRNKWFDEIIFADEMGIQQDIDSLEKTGQKDNKGRSAIVSSRNVSTDAANLSFFYIIYRLENSNLPDTLKHLAKHHTFMIMQYKCLTSILAHWFRYNAKEHVAVSTYAALSKKFGLKVYGSWGKWLEARADDFFSNESIHTTTYKKFNDDFKIVYMVNDTQGRIKDTLKNIREVMERFLVDDSLNIKSDAALIEFDGELEFKDKSRYFATVKRYIVSVIGSKADFIKPELINVVVGGMTNLTEDLLKDALLYISANYSPSNKEIVLLVDTVFTHAFDAISNQRGLTHGSSIAEIMAKLKSYYTASRSSDPLVLTLRDVGLEVVQKSTNAKNPAVQASIRTGILLYLILRAFTMHHYRG